MSNAEIRVTGGVGKDPEIRFTPNGTGVCSFSVGVSESRKENGEWVQVGETQWYRVNIWGKYGETAAEHVRKGDRVTVAGEFKLSTYEKDGETRTMPEITGNIIQHYPKRNNTNSNTPSNESSDGNPWA